MSCVKQCIRMYDEGNLPKCVFFFKPSEDPFHKGVLSQWYKSDFVADGIKYTSAEQYMMAQKAVLFNDDKTLEKILNEDNPAEIKKLGRLINNFDADIWDAEKLSIVIRGNVFKFSNDTMRQVLIATKNTILVEASPYDDIWGIKMAENTPGIENPHNWRGQNLLGVALMEARNILRNS